MPEEPKQIAYHGKTPTQIRQDMEEKKKQNKDNKYRRRARLFLVISFLTLAGLFAGYFLYLRGSKTDPHIQKVGNLLFRISCSSSFLYSEPLQAVLKVSNVRPSAREFVVGNFACRILGANGVAVYRFVFPSPTPVSLEGYDAREVFDFARDNPAFTLDPGNYTLQFTFQVDDTPVELNWAFSVVEKVSITLDLMQDFHLPNQSVRPLLRIQNDSPSIKSIVPGAYTFSVRDGNDSLVQFSDTLGNPEYQFQPGEKLDISLDSFAAPGKTGDFLLDYSYFINNELTQGTQTFLCREISSTYRKDKIRILPYSLKVVGAGEPYEAEILLANDTESEVCEQIESMLFSIRNNDQMLFQYRSERVLNIFMPAFSTRSVFQSKQWREIRFPTPGSYTVEILIKLKNTSLQYSEVLTVISNPNPNP